MRRKGLFFVWSFIGIILLALASMPVTWARPVHEGLNWTVPTRTNTPKPSQPTDAPAPTDVPATDAPAPTSVPATDAPAPTNPPASTSTPVASLTPSPTGTRLATEMATATPAATATSTRTPTPTEKVPMTDTPSVSAATETASRMVSGMGRELETATPTFETSQWVQAEVSKTLDENQNTLAAVNVQSLEDSPSMESDKVTRKFPWFFVGGFVLFATGLSMLWIWQRNR